MSGAGCTTTSPWLRRTPNGLRASKASRSVLHGAAPILGTIDEGRKGFDNQRLATSSEQRASDARPLTPSTPPQIRVVHPFAAVEPSSDDESSGAEFEFRAASPHALVIDESPPMSPLSRVTATTDDSTVQIVRARAQRMNTARARSHSINEIRQLLSPPPEAAQHLLPPWSPLHIKHPQGDNSDSLRSPRNELGPSTVSPGTQFSPRSPSPCSSSSSSLGPLQPPPRSAARRRPRAIVKDMGSLLEHIHEDESDRLNSGVRTARSFSLPAVARPCSDPALGVVSLPPPPRPRNRALVRSPVQTHTSNLHSAVHNTPPALVLQPPPRRSTVSECPPPVPPKDPRSVPTLTIPPPPRRDSLDHHRLSLYSIPWTPVGIPLPPSTATSNFPQSPHSTVFHTVGSPPATPQSASFLPSCKATSVRSSTIQDWQSRASEDRPDPSHRLSTLSNPFGDFSFLHPHPNNRVSGISFASDISGSSARSPTEAESIPIGLHRATSQDAERDDLLLPVTPRSSWLRPGFEVDVRLPQADEDEEEEEEDDESVTEESSRKSTEKSSVLDGRERAKSLTLAYIPIASLNKVDRVLGKGASRALISGVHDHVPHLSSPSSMSSSPENATPTGAVIVPGDPAQLSFLPSTAPPSAFSMGSLGRRLSKKSSPSSERRRSEEVPRPSSQATSGLMARMDRFIGRTPSPAGRTRELDSEDEAPSPPPVLTLPKHIHGRKHSSSDPSAGLAPITVSGRPSTSNMRTAAERAEMLKKTRKIQQMLGDVPPVSGSTGSTFYRVSRAARSEDSLVTPTSAVVVIGAGSSDVRGHRLTASLSSHPRLALSPALQTDGLLDIKTSGSGDDFGLGLNEGGVSPVTSTRPEGEDADGDGLDEEDEAMLARRAKRAKVAKLNRYLGSRVPPNLVLGLDKNWNYEQGLPDARSEDGDAGSVVSGKKKRRASDGDYVLLEEDMNDLSVMSSEEKARAVKRGAKMEQVFGERPPRKLYQVQTGADTPSKSEADDEDSEPDIDHDAEPLDDSAGGEHYKSYRASFNSLAYFVSNADRDSLEGLYDIVSGPTDEAQRNQFAARRKRAAKLSNFFGVSYRDLFGAVLDILESDVKEDKEEGTLSPAETQDLLRKLKSLKAKGQNIRGE